MNKVYEIINLNDNEIDSYINERLSELNSKTAYDEISLSDDSGTIYQNWINTTTPYLPSGNRSKGFVIDQEFIKDFILDIKKNFGHISVDKLMLKLNEEMLIKWFNMYVINYFGAGYNEDRRKEIYGYGSLNSIGETLNISDLKGLNVSRCIEKSASLNQILNFLGIDSSLVVSLANEVGHAYCLVNINNHYFIVDPNFYGQDENGKGIPYIFEIDPSSNPCSFDPFAYGDQTSPKVDYDFPKAKVSGIKK